MADKPEALREQLEALRTEIRGLAEIETLTEEQDARLSAALDEFGPLEQRAKAAEERAVRIDHVNTAVTDRAVGHDAPAQINRTSPFAGEVRSMNRGELRDNA